MAARCCAVKVSPTRSGDAATIPTARRPSNCAQGASRGQSFSKAGRPAVPIRHAPTSRGYARSVTRGCWFSEKGSTGPSWDAATSPRVVGTRRRFDDAIAGLGFLLTRKVIPDHHRTKGQSACRGYRNRHVVLKGLHLAHLLCGRELLRPVTFGVHALRFQAGTHDHLHVLPCNTSAEF